MKERGREKVYRYCERGFMGQEKRNHRNPAQYSVTKNFVANATKVRYETRVVAFFRQLLSGRIFSGFYLFH